MVELLVQMESVLNIDNTGKALQEFRGAHVASHIGDNRPILQAQIDVTYLTTEQRKRLYPSYQRHLKSFLLGCHEHGHTLFIYPYLKTELLIFFNFCYFLHHA